MFIRKFLVWAGTASAAERAPAAASLARALLDGELPKDEEYEAGVALAALADDPSPLVRRAIAEEIAPRADAPRQILIALAADQSAISTLVLQMSPALTDADLIEAAVIGDHFAQAAIAARGVVSPAVSAALIEIARRDAVVALLDNPGASVPAGGLARVVERFERDASVREALLARPDLPHSLRARLVDATAAALQDFLMSTGWIASERLERVTREAREKSYVLLARPTDGADADGVTRWLREAGRLTTALLLRSLLSGERRLLESAFCELTGIARERVAGIVAQFDGAAFAALYSRAGLPEALLPVFRFALAAQLESAGTDEFADGGLQRGLVETALARCAAENISQAEPVLGLLRRFHAEAARQEAREFAAWLDRTQVMAVSDSTEPEVVAECHDYAGVEAVSELADGAPFEASPAPTERLVA